MPFKKRPIDLPISEQFAQKLNELGVEYRAHVASNQLFSSNSGGLIEYLAVIDNFDDLKKITSLAAKNHFPYRVIGKATGTLLSDVGYIGLLIINRCDRLIFTEGNNQVIVDAGLPNDQLVNSAAARNLGGLEFLSAIPGTIGGAIASGAFFQGKQLLTSLRELTLYFPREERINSVSDVSGESLERLFHGDFPAVILTAKLQLSSVVQGEILRRVSFYKHYRQRNANLSQLGYFLNGEITSLSNESKKLLRSYRIDTAKNDLNVWQWNIALTSEILREVIDKFNSQLLLEGTKLDERLTYLGYWPSREEESESFSSTDTESI